MTQRDDEMLSRALCDLARESASPGFRRRVLAAMDNPPRRPRWRALAALTAAAAALVIAVVIGREPTPAVDPMALEAQDLRREVAELERELATLRALAEDTAPVIYLGTQDDYDVVLDLAPVLLGEQRPRASARPAVHRPGDGGRPRF